MTIIRPGYEECPSCRGTGQPGGVKGGPELGLCGTCLGRGYVPVHTDAPGSASAPPSAAAPAPEPTLAAPPPARPRAPRASDGVTDRALMSGRVKRYATWPVIREQTVGDHCWGVFEVYRQIFGPPSTAVAMYIHQHDSEELVVGDPPFPIKRQYPAVKEAYSLPEQDARSQLGLPDAAKHLADREKVRIKICDLLEMYQFGHQEREMGNFHAVPIITRTREAAIVLARENLPFEERHSVMEWISQQDGRHARVLKS